MVFMAPKFFRWVFLPCISSGFLTVFTRAVCLHYRLLIKSFPMQHVGWWSPTIIRGDDREAVLIPNHKFSVSVVRNLTQKTHWRIKTHIAINHCDVKKINVGLACLLFLHPFENFLTFF